MSDHITTYTKVHFTPLSPRACDVRIEDIAHALSLMTRANGHFPEFHSIAQHCIECSEEAAARGESRRVQLAALLHDAGEAYMADITRPIKVHLPTYRTIEDGLLSVIYERFLGGITAEEAAAVSAIDDALLYHEFLHFMGEEVLPPQPIVKKPTFAFEPFDVVERRYIALFEKLKGQREGQ